LFGRAGCNRQGDCAQQRANQTRDFYRFSHACHRSWPCLKEASQFTTENLC
jgi:hypothetical protein